MKTVGIIGGVGPSTTSAFYMRVIRLAKQMYNARPPLIIHSVPVPPAAEEKFLRTGKDIKDYASLLKNAALSLERAGANMVVMPCNSLHHLENEIRGVISVPFLSIVDATVKHLQRVKVQRIGILGAPLTLQESLYVRPLTEQGIDCVVPNTEDQAVLGTIIRNIVFGEKDVSDETRLMQVMVNLHQRGAKHLLLACTDLQEMENRHPSCTVHDTMEILAQAVCGELASFTTDDYTYYFTEEWGDAEDIELEEDGNEQTI